MLKEKIKKINFQILGAVLAGVAILILIITLVLLAMGVIKDKNTFVLLTGVVKILLLGGILLVLLTSQKME